jgi:hypothetical protein
LIFDDLAALRESVLVVPKDLSAWYIVCSERHLSFNTLSMVLASAGSIILDVGDTSSVL